MSQVLAAAPVAKVSAGRSQESLAFEAFWRAMPRKGLIPHRRAFEPARAARFLKDILLTEVSIAPPSFRIRLVGSAFHQKIGFDATGRDYLEFLPREYHAGAVAAADLMFRHPSGLWQLTAMHFQRGFSQMLEATAFPLLADGEGAHQLLIHVHPLQDLVVPAPLHGRVMQAETAATFEFIDVGAGLPPWPQA